MPDANGTDDFGARLAAAEQTIKAHDYAIGKLASIGADVERYTQAVADERAETRGLVAGLGARFDRLESKLGLVDQKAETASLEARRASLTNELDAPKTNEHPSRRPEENVVAELAGDVAVDALRHFRGRGGLIRLVLLLVAALAGGTAAGARLQACTPTQHATP